MELALRSPDLCSAQATVRLSDFIKAHLQEILGEWEAYARSRAPSGAEFDGKVRDHAEAMLCAIAEDLAKPERVREEIARSEGIDDAAAPDAAEAAEKHGAGRAEYGFTLEQMVSEFRVLRRITIKLWRAPEREVTATDFDDLRRFDDAVDQTLLASVSRYKKELDHARETFLGVLGHDLKSPLSAIIASAQFLLEAGRLSEDGRNVARRIERSGRRMHQMVNDLLDFTRSRLGKGIPIERTEVDLGRVVREVVDEFKASQPGKRLEVATSGELAGSWDAKRISQALSNLIGNAVQHGHEDTPISISASARDEEVMIAVHNEGPAVHSDKIGQLFNPLSRVNPTGSEGHDPTHLGLGLYIAQAIANAHGGQIEVESSDREGTTFTIRLPRRS
jgi:signal transduction histidine kinase